MLENLSFSFCKETRARVSVFFSLVGEASEYFREIGGLMFINDLAKSSVHCIVKEAALFTLGIIIESNGNKNNISCVSECIMAPCHYLCFVSIFFWSHKMRLQDCHVEQEAMKVPQFAAPDLISSLLICAHRVSLSFQTPVLPLSHSSEC